MKRSDDSKMEAETIFRFDANLDTVSVFTAWPPAFRKLKRKGYKPSRTSTQKGKECGWFFKIPFGEFRWSVGRINHSGNSSSLPQDAHERS